MTDMAFMTHLILDYQQILYFSHLSEHKFRHNFSDTLNPLCSCTLETEDTEHYFLCWQNYLSFGTTFMDDLNNITTALASLNPYDLLRVILYGDKFFAKKLIARYQLHLSNL